MSQLSERYPISVIIPCYNAADTLDECLEALGKNDLTNVEVIIVDDASTDNTAELIKKAESFDERILYIPKKKRSGPGAARNRGLILATCPYLFFLDADIVLPDQAIHWIRETFDIYSHQEQVAGVLGTYSEKVPFGNFSTNFKNLYTCYLYHMTDTFSPFIHTPMFAVKKELLKREGGFDPEMTRAEDFKLGTVLGSKGYRFIIDWRIVGTHLKKYSMSAILREDWNRIGELKRIQLTAEQRKFSYRAHRWTRILSLLLPGTTVLLSVLSIVWSMLLWPAGAALLLFLLVNSPLFLYFRRHQGTMFAVSGVFFLFVEMLWAQLALVLNR
jgi:glycosyltransferase involved in cell wall biosynthesis